MIIITILVSKLKGIIQERIFFNVNPIYIYIYIDW